MTFVVVGCLPRLRELREKLLSQLDGGKATSVIWVRIGNRGNESWFLYCRDCHGLEKLPLWDQKRPKS